jgi:serine/threonine-protein kinase
MGPPGDPQTTSPAEAQAVAADVDLAGQTLGDFHILRRLGRGGMGEVYLAEQLSLRRKVALKLLKPELSANATALARFKLEAQAVAKATHANIVQVYAIDQFANGLHYMALEYVEGRTLRQYLEKKGPPEILVALSIIRQVAAALQRASELGIIHRDIKPENILLTRKTEVKVADFGLSRCFTDDVQPLNITQSGVTMGTPLYMSPEQVEGKPVDPRTDIYSFGVTCYHMLAGQPPFRGKTAFEVAVQHVQGEAAPLASIRPDLPAEVCALVHRMMARRPDDRFQTGREIVREVGRLRDALVGVLAAGGQPTNALLPAAVTGAADVLDSALTQPVVARPPRRWGRLAAVAAVVLALGGGLGFGWWRNQGQAPATVPSAPAPEPAAGKAPVIRPEREQALKEALKLHTNPKTPQELRRGLDDRIDLGVLYLKRALESAPTDEERRSRLDQAEAYFKELDIQDGVKGYRMLGQLGRAMTLAFRDEWKESNKLFVRLWKEKNAEKGSLEAQLLWVRNQPLREMMAAALSFNHANAPASFPSQLEKLRHPPAPKQVKGG